MIFCLTSRADVLSFTFDFFVENIGAGQVFLKKRFKFVHVLPNMAFI